MKKNYIAPAAEALQLSVESMVAASIGGVNVGDGSLEFGGDDNEGLSGSAKENPFGETIFD